MRGATRLLVQSAIKPIKPVNAQARMMTVTPQRHEKENSSSESAITKDENVEPLVAFGRPPPLPPVLGPLVAFSFFQMGLSKYPVDLRRVARLQMRGQQRLQKSGQGAEIVGLVAASTARRRSAPSVCGIPPPASLNSAVFAAAPLLSWPALTGFFCCLLVKKHLGQLGSFRTLSVERGRIQAASQCLMEAYVGPCVSSGSSKWFSTCAKHSRKSDISAVHQTKGGGRYSAVNAMSKTCRMPLSSHTATSWLITSRSRYSALPGFLGVSSMSRAYSSDTGIKPEAAQSAVSNVPSTESSKVGSAGGDGSSWIEILDNARKSTIDATTDAGKKLMELTDAITPHVQQLFDANPSLEKRWKTNFIAKAMTNLDASSIERDKLSVFDKVSSLGLIGLGVMGIAEACGVAVQSILTVGGVGGVATAFAARDVLGNMLSGFSLQFSRPFVAGDYIKAGSIEGKVIEIGLTSTSLINPEKLPVIVPNSLFSSQMIVNRSRASWRASVTKIPIRIEDIEKVPSVSEDIKEMVRSNPNVSFESDAPYCYLSRLESSYGELTIGCNLKNMVCLLFFPELCCYTYLFLSVPLPKKDEWLSAEQDILLAAARIIKSHGIELGSTMQCC
ncbi:hypothetical protein PR202_gb14608 [Eleusine coracana subsp. coracana]|uniref:Mechanosensitive ion channel MscS domain-containing protein n=1 Tax=Eleusine coracana subsp. coracana TaxID=191504 RepID=A0AAV5EVV7_ELECO|nr:hypothetical protein PR202_gb14608 [Eleusine coracana subsp. coracana]